MPVKKRNGSGLEPAEHSHMGRITDFLEAQTGKGGRRQLVFTVKIGGREFAAGRPDGRVEVEDIQLVESVGGRDGNNIVGHGI